MKNLKALAALVMAGSMAILAGCSSSAPATTAAPAATQAAADTQAAAADTQAAAAEAPAAAETDWPKNAVTVVVPYSAGGDTDTYCRTMCKLLGEELNQNFVVVNTTGGSGVVASTSVMGAKNDGYTMLFHHTGVMLTQEAVGSNQFSFFDDFDVVGTVARDDTYALIVKKEDADKWGTLEDMIAWAKENPGQIKFSVTFNGATHAVAEQMQREMGIEMNNIDVGSSGADRLTAFMAKQCDLLVINYMNIKDYVENGDFIVLGVCAEERLAGLEDIPTLKEQGYNVIEPKQYEVRFPKDTDPAIEAKLSAALEKVTASPEFAETLATYYAQPFYRNAEDTISQDKEEVETLKGFFAQ